MMQAQKLFNEEGFTLIEVLLAIAILAFGLLALAAVIFGLRRNPCRRRPALHVAEEHIAVPIVELTRTSETRANLPPHDSTRAANSMQGR